MAKERLDFIIGASVGEFSSAIKKAKGNLKELSEAVKQSKAGLGKGFMASPAEKKARDDADALLRKIKELTKAEKDLTREQKARLNGQVAAYKASLQSAAPSAAVKQQQDLSNKSITLRYALYDVGAAANQASQAMLGYAGALLKAQIAQQSAFSQIEKTLVGVADEAALDTLKQQLLELSGVIPVSFAELTKIGMLGSQLGVASTDIAKFTEVVAKFSAITGISVEETAMGFGKVANLLGLNSDQFQSLGAAIAKVGVSSAATEQQIINTAGQIGAVARAAGLSASEIIGLSGALASLKIAPEEARGVLVQTFQSMDAAARTFNDGIGQGGEQLRIFADIAGISSEEFAKGWGDKSSGGASKVWEKFVTGLSTTDVSRSLARLGLDGIRTSKGLTALASDIDSIFGPQGAIALAREAGTSGTFLDESFATIVEDLSSKLKMLQNSFENLFAAAASDSNLINILGWVIDSVKNLNVAMTNLLNKGSFLSGAMAISIAIAGIAAVVLSAAATIAIATGGFLALRTAFMTAAAEGIITRGTLAGLVAQLFGIAPAAKAASAGLFGLGAAGTAASAGIGKLAVAMRVMKLALASTGIGLAVVLIGELVSVLMQAGDAGDETVTGLDEVQQAVKKVRDEAQGATQELVDFVNQALLPMQNLLGVENALYSLGQALQKGKNDFSQYSVAGRANLSALQSTISAYTTAAQGDQQVLADNLTALMNYMISAGYGTAEAFKLIQVAIAQTGKTANAVLPDFSSLTGGFKDVGGGAGKAKTALEKLDEVLQKLFKNYDVKIGIQDSLDALGKSIATNGKVVGYSTKGMRDNLKALQDVITAFKESSNGDLSVFSGNLRSLRATLVQMGVTGTTAFKLIDTALAKTKGKGKSSAKEIAAIYAGIGNALATEQAKNIKTIGDYVSDLSSVLKDAFENRYGEQEAKDSITSAFDSIRESAADAADAIDDAVNSIAGLKADKGVLEYQLGIAIKYGDTLRANSIKAKLDKVNKDITDQEEAKAKATEEASTALEGNTKGAIANRAKMRDLVQTGNDYLLTLANSGASAETLSAEAEKLANDFLTQGTNLGFAETELKKYTAAFKSDFTTVVNGVPKDITIKVNSTDPALQAVKDFVAKTNAELQKIVPADIRVGVQGDIPSGGGNGNPGQDLPEKPKTPAEASQISNVSSLTTKLATAQKTLASLETTYTQLSAKIKGIKPIIVSGNIAMANPAYTSVKNSIDSNTSQRNNLKAQIKALQASLKSAGKATGGLITGPGTRTSDSILTPLSNGEYVIQANAVSKYGVDFMNSLNQMQVQRGAYGSNGPAGQGSNVVHLSPEDRQLLRAAADRPLTLYSNDQRIASSTNSGNAILAQRGLS